MNNVSFEVAEGEFCILLGPSGCGKSTVLRLIAGLEQPTAGSIVIDGKPVDHLAPRDRDIAFVFQSYALYPHMTVFENLAFSLRLRRAPRAEIESKVRDAAQLLEIDTLLERRPQELSGGQRQRVALGRAIVRQPKIFLFDEPLSNLDAALRATMRVELTRLHRRLHATIVYVTHDQAEALTLGEKVIVLHQGVIQQIGSPSEIYHKPANISVARFVGSPQMNLLEGRLDEDGVSSIAENCAWIYRGYLKGRCRDSRVRLSHWVSAPKICSRQAIKKAGYTARWSWSKISVLIGLFI